MKKKDQSSGSAKQNQQIIKPLRSFPEKSLATKYWWTGQKESRPIRIYNLCKQNGEDTIFCIEGFVAREALKVKHLETFHQLKVRFKNDFDIKEDQDHSGILIKDLTKNLDVAEGSDLTEAYINKVDGFKAVIDFITLEKELEEPILCISKPHFLKGLEILEAQATLRFFEMFYEDIFEDGKAGFELLKEAEDHLDQVCNGIVPRRLKKQVRESKAKAEESK